MNGPKDNIVSQEPPNTFLNFLFFVIKPYKGYVTTFIFLGIVSGCYGTINSYITKIIIDSVSEITEREALISATIWPAIFFLLNFEVQSIAWRGMNYVNMKIAPLMKNDIINSMFSYVHRHSFRFFQDNFSGTIASNINLFAYNFELAVNETSMHVFRGLVQLLLALVGMYFVNPIFMFALLTWTIIFMSSSFIYSGRIKKLSDEFAESESIVAGKIVDSVSNAYNVRVFSQQNLEFSYLQRFLEVMKEKFRNKEWFLIKFYLAQGFSITILIAVMLYYLIKLRIENLVTVGDFAFILGLVLFVTENIWWLTEQIDQINDSIGKCNQSLNKLIVEREIKDKPDAKELVVTKGEIVFDNVHFHYKGTEPLFKNKSIIIPAGQKLGLVGFSGSGKTTFVNLILRLYDLTSGRIRIDGQDIGDVTQDSLRAAIGLIPQEPTLFHRTLMENIRYGKADATDEEVIAAAKKAHAHEFIKMQPKGYQTMAGERGVKLSGGQRQRIAIARAILKNAPILILDEATSQLDSITENDIQDSMNNLMQGKTTLVIAHRLSTLLHMDRILVFDKGKIVGDGTHKQLISKVGLYKTLWNAQVGGVIPDNKDIVDE